mgnify:CR=1 FL=1
MRHIYPYIVNRLHAASQCVCSIPAVVCMALAGIALSSCEREPMLHLHQGGTDINMELPAIDLDLKVYWDYLFKYDVEYDWEAEWIYGWDDTDTRLFGPIGYTEPTFFNVRRYFTGNVAYGQHSAPYKHQIEGNYISAKYDFGYWDILAWNEIQTEDEVQSVRIDESSTYDYVTAYTGQSMVSSRYNAPQFTHAFYQPEELFAGYESGIEINRNLDGFTYDAERNCWVRRLDLQMQPVTYIYLVQIILRNNHQGVRKVTAIDGSANFSGMSRSVTLNSGQTGLDAITVNFNMRMKQDLTDKQGNKVDVIGGKVLTFGLPNLNPGKLSTRNYAESLKKVGETDLNNRHYLDLKMQFYNGMDSTLVFDITDQVRRLFRGGVITIELDMNKVPLPYRSGGSSFDAVVKEWEEKEWEIEM